MCRYSYLRQSFRLDELRSTPSHGEVCVPSVRSIFIIVCASVRTEILQVGILLICYFLGCNNCVIVNVFLPCCTKHLQSTKIEHHSSNKKFERLLKMSPLHYRTKAVIQHSATFHCLLTQKLQFLLTIFMGSKKVWRLFYKRRRRRLFVGVSSYSNTVDCKHVFPFCWVIAPRVPKPSSHIMTSS